MRLCDRSISGDMLSSGKFMAGALYQASEQCQSRVRKRRKMGPRKDHDYRWLYNGFSSDRSWKLRDLQS